jgi:nicotinate phosphoribosyltransferase
MQLLNHHTGLYTDHYELSMAQGYFLNGMEEATAVFDYFFRKNPYDGGYVVFAGLADLLELLENYKFEPEDCRYLEEIGFKKEFVSYLKDFRVKADIYSVREGEIVFPYESCLRVEGGIIETQLIETLVLNVLNFESLIATKASRMRMAAGNRILLDFGLRRAHGLGGIQASRAAVCGGFDKTSNVYSARQFGLDSTGTMAHSWVQSFKNELTAFRAFAEFFPDSCILLVDTYDTLDSGVPNAIKVGKEMESQGKKLAGIRLDSGDLAFLSKKVREMLDQAGLDYVKIVASNQLDEYVIKSLVEQSAPVDAFGVGTALVTGDGAGSLDGVYKLSVINGVPTLKISENINKITLPGRKNIYRYFDENGMFTADAISLDGEGSPGTIYHPIETLKSSDLSCFESEQILRKVMDKGRMVEKPGSPGEIYRFVRSRLEKLPGEHKRFMNPHVYKVGISGKLLELRSRLIDGTNHSI